MSCPSPITHAKIEAIIRGAQAAKMSTWRGVRLLIVITSLILAPPVSVISVTVRFFIFLEKMAYIRRSHITLSIHHLREHAGTIRRVLVLLIFTSDDMGERLAFVENCPNSFL